MIKHVNTYAHSTGVVMSSLYCYLSLMWARGWENNRTPPYSSTCWQVTICYTDAVSVVKCELQFFFLWHHFCLIWVHAWFTQLVSPLLFLIALHHDAKQLQHTKCILRKITRHKFPFQNKCKFTWTTSMFKTVKIQTTPISQLWWHIKHLSGSSVPGSTGLVTM